jgi:carboxyl-terminal processing protease
MVIRGNAADPHKVELVREARSGPAVTGRLEGKAGYVRIAGFDSGVAAAISTQVQDLARRGANALVVDIRGTATGPLEAGLASARLFVAKGTLAIKEARGAERQPVTAGGAKDGAIALPVWLLVNDGTSGAAELFASALASNKRGTLVGERTQGRAAMQKLVKLPDGTGMLISNAWYLTAAGEPIHDKGLAPAIAVEGPDVDFGAPAPAADPILQKALEEAARAR